MPQIDSRLSILLLLSVLLFAAAGCSSGNSNAAIDPDTGKHPTGWTDKHGDQFLSQAFTEPDECQECHGTNYRGGVTNVSCFAASFNGMSCHANGPSSHHNTPLNVWIGSATDPTKPPIHGEIAKKAPGDNTGFASCQICHGTPGAPFFGGGVIGPSCFLGCHGPAPSPHPNSWLPDDTFSHTTTDPGNAVVCANCHLNQNNLPADAKSLLPPFTFNAGAPPGCFNSTLCHGAVAPASHDANWVNFSNLPEPHGNAAKAAPGLINGFSYCQQCHGVDFAGGFAQRACLDSCHGPNPSPHPNQWLPDNGGIYLHTTTNPGNAPVCIVCHLHGANLPPADVPPDFIKPTPAPPGTPAGCFNATLCHGPLGGHTDPNWAVNHSTQAVAFTTQAQIASNCGFTGCHGPDLKGSSGPSCYSCHLGSPWLHTTAQPIQHPGNPTPAVWGSEQGHPKYLETGGSTGSCFPASPTGYNVARYCHGPSFTSTASQTASPPNKFPDWQTPGPVCQTCHSGTE